jgi:DNA-binding GntR family transcriptional regulator
MTDEMTVPGPRPAPPKYLRISDHIRDLVQRGRLQPGDEVPSERQLAAEWDVARPTATKALDLLRREGWLVGRQGSGTYVADRPEVHRQAAERYRRASETGRIYLPNERAHILRAGVVPAPSHVAGALGMDDVSPQAIRRERLTLRDDEPVELSISWFDPELALAAPALRWRRRIVEGTLAYVERSTGRRGQVVRERRCARLASPRERKLLGLGGPAAVLSTEHLVIDGDGRALEVCESVAPPDSWTVAEEHPLHR